MRKYKGDYNNVFKFYIIHASASSDVSISKHEISPFLPVESSLYAATVRKKQSVMILVITRKSVNACFSKNWIFATCCYCYRKSVGSGVFMLPQVLAPFGLYALCGWLASGAGALTLALVFVGLVKRLPHTGGPHVYVQAALGPIAGYFTGWTYWLVSSLSCATVIASTINYLTPIIGVQGPAQFAACELALLALVCVINLRGVASASLVEAILAVIKAITLILIPLAGFTTTIVRICKQTPHFSIVLPLY